MANSPSSLMSLDAQHVAKAPKRSLFAELTDAEVSGLEAAISIAFAEIALRE